MLHRTGLDAVPCKFKHSSNSTKQKHQGLCQTNPKARCPSSARSTIISKSLTPFLTKKNLVTKILAPLSQQTTVSLAEMIEQQNSCHLLKQESLHSVENGMSCNTSITFVLQSFPSLPCCATHSRPYSFLTNTLGVRN